MSSVIEPSIYEAAGRFPFSAAQTKSGFGIRAGIRRRLVRERRRRKVGRAYDMALEIARIIPEGSEVLDVGCGNGYIAHHLSALLGTEVLGIDVASTTEARINYQQYDGMRFFLKDKSVDAVVLCYVLHHAADALTLLTEVKRVLRSGGVVVIYEDIPESFWDKAVCWIHNRKWKERTGPCTFRSESRWQSLFNASGFEIVRERRLSRWRNCTHPVCRDLYLLKPTEYQL